MKMVYILITVICIIFLAAELHAEPSFKDYYYVEQYTNSNEFYKGWSIAPYNVNITNNGTSHRFMQVGYGDGKYMVSVSLGDIGGEKNRIHRYYYPHNGTMEKKASHAWVIPGFYYSIIKFPKRYSSLLDDEFNRRLFQFDVFAFAEIATVERIGVQAGSSWEEEDEWGWCWFKTKEIGLVAKSSLLNAKISYKQKDTVKWGPDYAITKRGDDGTLNISIGLSWNWYDNNMSNMRLRYRDKKFIPNMAINSISQVGNFGEGVTPNDEGILKIELKNIGKVPAENVKYSIVPARSYQGFHIDQSNHSLSSISPKDIKFISIPVTTKSAFPGEKELLLTLTDNNNYTQSIPLKIDISTSVKAKQTEIVSIDQPIVDLSKEIPKTTNINKMAVAVVIGNSKYQKNGVPNVNWAEKDAAITKEYLIKSLGIKKENIIYHENATLSELRTTFGDENDPNGKLSSFVRNGVSDVYVFYSGHGAPNLRDKSPYLMPVDADPDRIALSGYPLSTLYNNLAKLNARSVFVILDACFSGASGDGSMIISQASPVGYEVTNPTSQIPNSVIIAASTGSQFASWLSEAKHGMLTYFFLNGLRGNADLDKNGIITVAEMREYLQNKESGIPYMASRLFGREQMPQVWGQDDFVIK